MKVLFFVLALASVLAPALSVRSRAPDDYFRFNFFHSVWYTYGALNCTTEMNSKLDVLRRVQRRDTAPCRPSAIMVLDEERDVTPDGDMRNICRGDGTSAGGDLFTSNKSFRVAKCVLQNRGAVAPNCVYKARFAFSPITVACAGRYPTHLDGTDPYE